MPLALIAASYLVEVLGVKAFISYSHNDEWALERLHKHLAMLRREQRLTTWYDRDVLAGGDLDSRIAEQLEASELFVALASPDFIDSKYCYEREMERAFELHEDGRMRIVPIIVEPCDWKSSPLVRFKALPKDGKAITEWTNQNSAFLDIVTELRRVLDAVNDSSVRDRGLEATQKQERKSYRLRRAFDEIDKADFRRQSFDIIFSYFESATAEIDSVEGIKARFRPLEPRGFTCSVLNQELRAGPAHLTVRESQGRRGIGDIYYSFSENAPDNSASGAFDVDVDDYDLFLIESLGGSAFSYFEDKEKLTARHAAEVLWEKLLEKTGISYA
jgi:hypothetical protein